jgi:DNA-binding NarL/FixJ family response regulator
MKIEEDMPQTSFFRPGRPGTLVASEAFQSRTFAMSRAIQSVGISVSMIEGNSNASRSFCDWLRLADGFSLLSQQTASSALVALSHEKPAIVLMDIDTPQRNPFDYLHQLKSTLPQTQFVALVADEDADYIFKTLSAGATGYILRQAVRSELLAALKLIHAGGSPMSGGIARKVIQSFQSPANSTSELSPRETRILRLLASGSSHREAAAALNISLPMISTYIRSIYEKLHLLTEGKILQ